MRVSQYAPAAGRQLMAGLAAGEAFRVGEAAVVSTKVHLLQADAPGVVTVLTDADAGHVFYRRTAPGEICHIDLFHEPAEVDHRAAAAVLRAVTARAAAAGRMAPSFADYIDVQTGTGGGRITGTLAFGQRATVREAHYHHLHVTVRRDGVCPAFLPEAIDELEQMLLQAGVPIRRVDGIRYSRGGSGRLDLSDYSDRSDSYLKHRHADSEATAAATGPHAGVDLYAPLPARRSRDVGWRQLAELSDAAGGLAGLQAALRELSGGPGRAQFGAAHSLALLRQLEAAGLATDQRGQLALTGAGRRLAHRLSEHMFEVEQGLRRSYSTVASGRAGGADVAAAWGPRVRRWAAGRARDVRPVPAGHAPAALDAAATVAAALQRRQRATGPLVIVRDDWREQVRRRRMPPSIMLLIDCSASMAGRRLQAAKFLARHLLVAAKARVAVMSFQADSAELVLPFTRCYRDADRGLCRLTPAGLTPLARGLTEAVAALQSEKSRRPLLLLITDGIPTVPLISDNPVSDALAAAARVAEQRLAFGCIGLEPSRSYLTAIAAQGQGSLYILDDLEEEGLVAAAQQQLLRHRARLRAGLDGRRQNG